MHAPVSNGIMPDGVAPHIPDEDAPETVGSSSGIGVEGGTGLGLPGPPVVVSLPGMGIPIANSPRWSTTAQTNRFAESTP